MSIATLIRRMTDAGAPPEAIALAVEEIEAMQELLDSRRTADRDRKRAQREAQKSANVLGHSGDSPETVTVIAPPPLPPLKASPDPIKNTPPISPTPTNPVRAKRLPDDWFPAPLTGKALAMVALWQSGEMEREIAKFRNYWIGKAGKDACKTDWQRTFINWLISADERKPRNGGQSNTVGRHQSPDGLSPTTRAAARVFGTAPTRQPGTVPG